MVGRRRAELDREQDALARAELVGVDPGLSPRARPAVSTARASSTPNAPRSQNTSIHRACGAHASSISPHTSATYAPASPSNSAGTTCAPRYVTSPVTSAASATDRASSSTVSPYPDLHSKVVVPCASISAGEPAQPGPEVGVGGGPRRGHRRPDAAGRVGAPGHPRRELGRPLPREHQVRVRVDEPGQHRPPGRVDRLIRRRRRADGPAQTIRSPSITSAAS